MDNFIAIVTIKIVRQRPADGGQPGQMVHAAVQEIQSSAIGPTQWDAFYAAVEQDVATFIEKLDRVQVTSGIVSPFQRPS